MFLKKLNVILRLGNGKKYKNELGFKSNRVDINMSFFWFSEPKPQPKAPVRKTVEIQPTPVAAPSSVASVLEPERKVDSHRQVEPEPEVKVPQSQVEPPPSVSTRSVPTADAFTQVYITHRPKKRVDLTVEVPVCKSVSISDACTPVQSAYNSPRYDVQFQPEPKNPYDDLWPCSEPCTPTSAYSRRSEEEFKLQTTIHHLENLFNKGLYHNLKAVHQGVYKDTVLHGGHVAAPDREDLDARENIHLFNPTSYNQVIEIQHKYVELVAESRKFHERLEVLTGQLGDLTLDF